MTLNFDNIEQEVEEDRRAQRRRWIEGGEPLLRRALEALRTGVPMAETLPELPPEFYRHRDLSGAPLDGFDFPGWNLDGVDLTFALVRKASFRGASLVEADMTWIEADGADFREADLTDAFMGSKHLRDVDFRGARMRNIVLSGSDLTGSRFEGADLRDANLMGAIGADLSGADIRGAIIRPFAPDRPRRD